MSKSAMSDPNELSICEKAKNAARTFREAANMLEAIHLEDAVRGQLLDALRGMKAIVPNGSQWVMDAAHERISELEAEVERLRAANKAAARLLEAEPVRLANRLRDCEAQRDEAVALLREPMTDSATTTGEYGGPGCWFCDTEGGHAEDCRANAFLSEITPSNEE